MKERIARFAQTNLKLQDRGRLAIWQSGVGADKHSALWFLLSRWGQSMTVHRFISHLQEFQAGGGPAMSSRASRQVNETLHSDLEGGFSLLTDARKRRTLPDSGSMRATKRRIGNSQLRPLD